MAKYVLGTNVSGMKYWSLEMKPGDNSDNIMHEINAKKHGGIYVNRRGGFMPKDCMVTIHKTVERDNFPSEDEK